MFCRLRSALVSRRLAASSASFPFDSRRVCCTALSRRFWRRTNSTPPIAERAKRKARRISATYIARRRALRSLYACSIWGRIAMSRHERMGEL